MKVSGRKMSKAVTVGQLSRKMRVEVEVKSSSRAAFRVQATLQDPGTISQAMGLW